LERGLKRLTQKEGVCSATGNVKIACEEGEGHHQLRRRVDKRRNNKKKEIENRGKEPDVASLGPKEAKG